MKKIILASQSPRRRELLQLLGVEFEVQPSGCEEKCTSKEPVSYVQELSAIKAADVAGRQKEECLVIGADTIVVFNGKILEKPKSEEDAFEMLSMLSGNVHQVFTGMTVIDTETGKTVSACECTDVEFYPVTKEEIKAYIKTGDPFDKAGAYGIQSKGAFLVKGIRGDYNNVVGLPVASLYRILKQF